jgi:hypothetical protein
MKCKFCGCTDKRACQIPMVYADLPDDRMLRELLGSDDYPYIVRPGQLAEFSTPCHWSAPGICSAPACVEKAYAEACALIDELVAAELVA